MARALLFFVVGLIIGGGTAWGLLADTARTVPANPTQVSAMTCDPQALEAARSKVLILEQELTPLREKRALVMDHVAGGSEVSSEPTSIVQENQEGGSDEATRWRISAIEKFVPLSDDQKARLRAKYDTEGAAKQRGEEAHSESLDEILGVEAATFYRQQVQASFDRAKTEEVEREVVWLARKLALSQQQEESVRKVLLEVEGARGDSLHGASSGTPQERLRAIIEENRRKAEKRNELLRQILSSDQYQAYLAGEAESPAADMEVFHDPGK